LRGAQFDGGMIASRFDHERISMGRVQASQTFDKQDKGAVKLIGPGTRWRIGVTGLAGAMLIAGAIVAFMSAQADARPNYVTASKPCGSCHPPNKPPKKK
jgi:hypothetical protein